MMSHPLLRGSALVHPAVGAPTISEAPEVRIARSPATGLISVWVSGVGYLDRTEQASLAAILTGGR